MVVVNLYDTLTGTPTEGLVEAIGIGLFIGVLSIGFTGIISVPILGATGVGLGYARHRVSSADGDAAPEDGGRETDAEKQSQRDGPEERLRRGPGDRVVQVHDDHDDDPHDHVCQRPADGAGQSTESGIDQPRSVLVGRDQPGAQYLDEQSPRRGSRDGCTDRRGHEPEYHATDRLEVERSDRVR